MSSHIVTCGCNECKCTNEFEVRDYVPAKGILCIECAKGNHHTETEEESAQEENFENFRASSSPTENSLTFNVAEPAGFITETTGNPELQVI